MRVAPLSVWKYLKVFESVWKCLELPEGAIKWNKLYCGCILLSLLRIFKRQKQVWESWLNKLYRSRIGSHDNFVKTKDTLSHWKNHFLSLMLMMVFYNAYIPLLIRQANDVEENPGPTIFDVIDPTRTICADHSQGNVALFGENADKQCVAMSLTTIIYYHIQDMNLWTSSTLNNILTIGNNLYIYIRCSVRTNDYLLLTDVPHIV